MPVLEPLTELARGLWDHAAVHVRKARDGAVPRAEEAGQSALPRPARAAPL